MVIGTRMHGYRETRPNHLPKGTYQTRVYPCFELTLSFKKHHWLTNQEIYIQSSLMHTIITCSVRLTSYLGGFLSVCLVIYLFCLFVCLCFYRKLSHVVSTVNRNNRTADTTINNTINAVLFIEPSAYNLIVKLYVLWIWINCNCYITESFHRIDEDRV